MSNTNPNRKPSNAGRYLFMLILGLVLGVIATVMAMRALEQRKDPFPDALMHVQQWHMGQLKADMEQNRCAATDTIPHVRTLRAMANDLEMAFPGIADDSRFKTHTSQFRADLDAALNAPPTDCAAAGALVEKVGTDCKACHQDFRG